MQVCKSKTLFQSQTPDFQVLRHFLECLGRFKFQVVQGGEVVTRKALWNSILRHFFGVAV
ncbi:hypothetical protein DNK59_15945 [Pseudomonas sp. TKO26]|nr:hypothetical protein DNK62_15945 [Pseudomonas sp. TKO30]PYY87631.1 hypothetical protein DNK61_15940 [Pseudomonas sp. TKO29]PYY90355.1 hypothetical protein DNK59_15945 [Pseudomonas sp. TKO26]PYY99539.1 hypothetical protein DNK60_15935 [Pseudomonas sp. TKO14]